MGSSRTARKQERRKQLKQFARFIIGMCAVGYILLNIISLAISHALNTPAEIEQTTSREAAAELGVTHNREYPIHFVDSADEIKRSVTSENTMFFVGDVESLTGSEKYLTFQLVKDGTLLSWDAPRAKVAIEHVTDELVLSVYVYDRPLDDVVWQLGQRGPCRTEFTNGLLLYVCEPSHYKLRVSDNPGEGSPFYGMTEPTLTDLLSREFGGDGGATVTIGPPHR